MSDATSEFEAIRTVHGALEPLDDEARTRVLAYIASLLGIDSAAVGSRDTSERGDDGEEDQGRHVTDSVTQIPEFSSFAELYSRANPNSNGEKALVAGYWLQECEGGDSFTGAAANKELNNMGHKLSNITDAIEQMKSRRPMLILQLRKSGTSRQARKLYKVSQEGVNRVMEMIGG